MERTNKKDSRKLKNLQEEFSKLEKKFDKLQKQYNSNKKEPTQTISVVSTEIQNKSDFNYQRDLIEREDATNNEKYTLKFNPCKGIIKYKSLKI